jgi:hypothetical protein
MRVQRAYKTELDLNDWQVKQERYRVRKKSPTAIELHRELNALKKSNVPWMYEVSKCAPQEALWNLSVVEICRPEWLTTASRGAAGWPYLARFAGRQRDHRLGLWYLTAQLKQTRLFYRRM